MKLILRDEHANCAWNMWYCCPCAKAYKIYRIKIVFETYEWHSWLSNRSIEIRVVRNLFDQTDWNIWLFKQYFRYFDYLMDNITVDTFNAYTYLYINIENIFISASSFLYSCILLKYFLFKFSQRIFLQF